MRLRPEGDDIQVLQDDAAEQRTDKYRRRRPLEQRYIRREAQHDAEREHDDADKRQEHDHAEAAISRAKSDGGIAAGHHEIPMREVHRARGIDHEHKAERNERIGGAESHSIEKQVAGWTFASAAS